MARDGDTQATPPSGSGRRERGHGAREAQEREAAEEAGTREVATVDRRAALTTHLEREAARGFDIETRTATQAVIVRSRRGWRFLLARRAERHVLSVDESGQVTTRAAEPVRW